MARIRTIKPEQPQDEELAALSIYERYLFAFLPTHADREGRLEDRPRVLKLAVFPWDEGVDVDVLLDSLAGHFIIRYESAGQRLIQIRQFLKHQRPNVREPASTLPPPTEEDMARASTYIKVPVLNARTLLHVTARVYKGTGREGNRKGTGRERSTHQSSFDAFWIAYPKKQGKQDALKAWENIAPDETLQKVILDAVRRQASAPDAGRDGWKFFKHAQGWLNSRRWEDEVNTGGRQGRVVGAAAPTPGKYDHIDGGV